MEWHHVSDAMNQQPSVLQAISKRVSDSVLHIGSARLFHSRPNPKENL